MFSQNKSVRKIIHVDMDSFYASIEIRDNPSLQNKPVAVGGDPGRRGVICTASYKAREYGVRSAMATAYALRLCPDLLVLPVDMQKYRAVSHEIRQIFYDYTDRVEPLSLDEAYLDVTAAKHHQGSATLIAESIRARIRKEFKLTASAGIAPNKFLAKVASDWRKPDGQFVITPVSLSTFVTALPAEKIRGVGKATAKKLSAMGVKTCGDLQRIPLQTLLQTFGTFGTRLHKLSFGIDDDPVEPNRIRKSVSVEETFVQDLVSIEQIKLEIDRLFDQLCVRMQRFSERKIKKQFVKIKYYDFQQTTHEKISHDLSRDQYQLLFQEGYERRPSPVRLIGIGVHFDDDDNVSVFQNSFAFIFPSPLAGAPEEGKKIEIKGAEGGWGNHKKFSKLRNLPR